MKIKFFLYCFLITLKLSAQLPNELIITEIMADPTPTKGLPEKEYIEIYNTSTTVLFLKNYTLIYGRFKVQLPESEIAPNSYAILVRKGNENDFTTFGKVIVLSQLSLPNTGAKLELQKNNSTVFSVNYSDKWYTKGKEQGYALEMIDTNYPCLENTNWTSSSSLIGGTPGAKNASASSNPDTTPPKLLFYETDNNVVQLTFDEKLDSTSVLNKKNYSSTSIGFSTIKISENSRDVFLQLATTLPKNELVDISIKQIADCSGNVAEDFIISIGNIAPADSGDIVLSELLFNPKLGGGDFVELYNTTERILSLKNWAFANTDINGKVDAIEVISKNNLLIKPKSYLAFCENLNFIKDFYPKAQLDNCIVIPKLPAFRNTNGSVILFNEISETVDFFEYDEKLHHPLIDNVDGVSLEKIDFQISSKSQSNWQSAASDVDYATPGYKNSQGNKEEEATPFYVEPQVFTPNADGYKDETILHYSFESGGYSATILIYSSSGFLVKRLIENKLLSTSGELTWDGTDNSGNILPIGYYLIVVNAFNNIGISKNYKLKVVLGQNL